MQGKMAALGFDATEMIASFPPPATFFETTWLAEPEQLADLQLARLKQELRRTAANPFYARRWAEAGFDPESVTSLADLPRVPACTVSEIRESIAKHPPFGEHQNFLLGDQANSGRVYFSDGTTGKTRPTVNVAWDVELYGVITGRALWLAGLRPGDMIMNAWTYGPHAAAPFADAGARWNGCLQITASSGAVTPTVKQVELMRDYRVRSVLTFGTHLLNLAETAQSMGLDPRKDFSLKAFPGPSAGLAPKIEDAWGVTAYESYGFNEVAYMAIECPAAGRPAHPGGRLHRRGRGHRHRGAASRGRAREDRGDLAVAPRRLHRPLQQRRPEPPAAPGAVRVRQLDAQDRLLPGPQRQHGETARDQRLAGGDRQGRRRLAAEQRRVLRHRARPGPSRGAHRPGRVAEELRRIRRDRR